MAGIKKFFRKSLNLYLLSYSVLHADHGLIETFCVKNASFDLWEVKKGSHWVVWLEKNFFLSKIKKFGYYSHRS
jgi:hypothetical protein